MTRRTRFVLCWLALALVAADDAPDLVALQAAVDQSPRDPARWIALAEAYELAGREPDALRAYVRAGAAAPAREALGRLRRFADPALAAADYEAAAELYGDAPEARRCRRRAVDCYAAAKDFGRATARLKALLEAPDANLADGLPEIYARCGRPASLLPTLKSFVAQVPASVPAQACLAAAYEANGDTQDAIALAEEIVAEHASVDAYRVIARAGAERVDRRRALLHMLAQKAGEAIPRRRPGEPPPDDDKSDNPAAKHTRAMAAALMREPAAVRDLLPMLVALRSDRSVAFDPVRQAVQFAAAAECLPELEDILKRLIAAGDDADAADVYSGLLDVYERRMKYAEVAELGERLLAKESKTLSIVGVQYRRAVALEHSDREAEALAAASDAVTRSADLSAVGTRLLKVDVLNWFDRIDEAAAEVRELLARFPDADAEARIRNHWASLAANRGDIAVAEAHLRRVLELAPNDAGAHNDLGYFLAERGQKLPEAERLCRFAVDRGRPPMGAFDPGGDDPAYRDSLGWVLFRRGRLTAARAELERALALPGGRGHSVIWEHYGDVLAATGQPDAARKAWAEALAGAPRDRRRKHDPRPEHLRRKIAAADR